MLATPLSTSYQKYANKTYQQYVSPVAIVEVSISFRWFPSSQFVSDTNLQSFCKVVAIESVIGERELVTYCFIYGRLCRITTMLLLLCWHCLVRKGKSNNEHLPFLYQRCIILLRPTLLANNVIISSDYSSHRPSSIDVYKTDLNDPQTQFDKIHVMSWLVPVIILVELNVLSTNTGILSKVAKDTQQQINKSRTGSCAGQL